MIQVQKYRWSEYHEVLMKFWILVRPNLTLKKRKRKKKKELNWIDIVSKVWFDR